MKHRNTLAALISFILIWSCSSNESNNTVSTKDSNMNLSEVDKKFEQQIKKDIALTEEKLRTSTEGFDELKAQDALNNFNDFISNYPNDSLTPMYTFKCGELSISLRQANNARKYFEQFIKNFPAHKRLPEAKFMLAFVYDDLLQDDNRAKELYTSFLKDYPNHSMALQAKQLVSLLFKSDADLIKTFKK